MLRWHLVTVWEALEYYNNNMVLEASVIDSGTQFFVKDIREDEDEIGVYINDCWYPYSQQIHIKVLPVSKDL
jgi:hypothetical protein